MAGHSRPHAVRVAAEELGRLQTCVVKKLALSLGGAEPLVCVISRSVAGHRACGEAGGAGGLADRRACARGSLQIRYSQGRVNRGLVYIDSEKLALSLGFESNELIRRVNLLLPALPLRQGGG